MKVLDLVLKAKWYNMIESGVKTEEYREMKDYWRRRLTTYNPFEPMFDYNFKDHCKNFDSVKFHYGYTNKTMVYKIEEIKMGVGKHEWGAPINEHVFIIKLGKRIE